MRQIFIASIVILEAACGQGVEPKSTESAVVLSDTKVTPEFRGFVAKAFELEVDGETYLDMEDFYTKELARLPAKVRDAGYDPEYDVQFDAQLGLSDLWLGMTVYMSTAASSGYLGETEVMSDGQFSVALPVDAVNDIYRVRANKRINVILTRGSEKRKICYNFSALDLSVPFTERSKPIILNKFSTALTSYECQTLPRGDGLAIPTTKTSVEKIKVGASKNEVLAVLGSDRLVVANNDKWCWFSRESAEHQNCALNIPSTCQCAVLFKGDQVISQENIKTEFIDITSF